MYGQVASLGPGKPLISPSSASGWRTRQTAFVADRKTSDFNKSAWTNPSLVLRDLQATEDVLHAAIAS